MSDTNTAAKRRMIKDAQAIRTQLRHTESLGDELMVNAFELGKRLLAARANPDVAPHIGQKAMIRLVSAQQSMVDACNDLFRVHDELSKVGVETGVMDTPGTTPNSALDDSAPEMRAPEDTVPADA